MECAVDECLWCEFDAEFYCEAPAAEERDDGEPMPCAEHADALFVHHVPLDRWRLCDSPGPPGTPASWHYKKVWIDGRRAAVQVFPTGSERKGRKYYWLFESPLDASLIKSQNDYGKPVAFTEVPQDAFPNATKGGVPCVYDPKANTIGPRPLAKKNTTDIDLDAQSLSCCMIQKHLEQGDVSEGGLEHMRRQLHVVKRCPRGRDCDILREVIHAEDDAALSAWCHVLAYRHPVTALGHYGYGEESLVWPCLRCHTYNERKLQNCRKCRFPKKFALHSAEPEAPKPLDLLAKLKISAISENKSADETEGTGGDDSKATSQDVPADIFKRQNSVPRPTANRMASYPVGAQASAPELLKHMHPPLSRDGPSLKVNMQSRTDNSSSSSSSEAAASSLSRRGTTPKSAELSSSPRTLSGGFRSRGRSDSQQTSSDRKPSRLPPTFHSESVPTPSMTSFDGLTSSSGGASASAITAGRPRTLSSGMLSSPPLMASFDGLTSSDSASAIVSRPPRPTPLVALRRQDARVLLPADGGEPPLPAGEPGFVQRHSSTSSDASGSAPQTNNLSDVMDFIQATHIPNAEHAEFLKQAATTPINVMKHGRKGNPKKRKIYVDIKKKAFVYSGGMPTTTKHIYFATMAEIRTGKATEVLERDTAAKVDASLCLSIVVDSGQRDSVDLQFADTDVRDLWAKHLRRLQIDYHG